MSNLSELFYYLFIEVKKNIYTPLMSYYLGKHYEDNKTFFISCCLFIFMLFIIVIINIYINAVRRHERKRIEKITAPFTTATQNISHDKNHIPKNIKIFTDIHKNIYDLKKQNLHKYRKPIFYNIDTKFDALIKENILKLHNFLEIITTQDYRDYNAKDFGFKTMYDLEKYIKQAYHWKKCDLNRALYYFAAYFDGVIVVCNNLVKCISERSGNECGKNVYVEALALRDQYQTLIKKYLEIELEHQISYNSNVAHTQYINTYRTDRHGIRIPILTANRLQRYFNIDFEEIERCYISYIERFYEGMECIHKSSENSQ